MITSEIIAKMTKPLEAEIADKKITMEAINAIFLTLYGRLEIEFPNCMGSEKAVAELHGRIQQFFNNNLESIAAISTLLPTIVMDMLYDEAVEKLYSHEFLREYTALVSADLAHTNEKIRKSNINLGCGQENIVTNAREIKWNASSDGPRSAASKPEVTPGKNTQKKSFSLIPERFRRK